MERFTFNEFLKEQFYNETLNPKFWNQDQEFDPDIRKKLLEIAEDFAESVGVSDEVQDIQLTGSLSNYNYTKYSDLDVHILLDFKDINKDEDLVKRALDGKRFVWNTRHDIKIRGHEVELYFQDVDEPHKASGLYSILDDQWLTTPVYDPPSVDERDVLKKAEQWEKDIDWLKEKIAKNKDNPKELTRLSEYGNKIRTKIQEMRKDSLEKDGEFGIGNLAFKHLRNTKAIETLINLTNKAYDLVYTESSFSKYYKETY